MYSYAVMQIFLHFTLTFYIPFLVVTTWRGHIENVTNMTMVEEQKMLLTSSLDCTVRIWTFDGDYIGKPVLQEENTEILCKSSKLKFGLNVDLP